MKLLIVSDLLIKIETVVNDAVADNIVKVTDAIKPVFFAALGLYVVYVAYRIIVTQQETVMSDVLKNIALFALIAAVISSNGAYTHYVVPFVMHGGQDLTKAITGVDAATSVDKMFEALYKTMKAYMDDGMKHLPGFPFIGESLAKVIQVYITFAVGVLGGIILILLVSIYLAVSTFMIGLLLSVGVIFICFAVFPSTRSMFTSWVGNCLNYIMLNVFYSVAFSILLKYIENEVKFEYTTPFDTLLGLKMLVIVLICGFVITQVGSMSSSLTGGVGINGLVSSVGSGMRSGGRLLAAATGGAGAAAGAIGSIMKAAAGAGKALLNRAKGGGNIKPG